MKCLDRYLTSRLLTPYIRKPALEWYALNPTGNCHMWQAVSIKIAFGFCWSTVCNDALTFRMNQGFVNDTLHTRVH